MTEPLTFNSKEFRKYHHRNHIGTLLQWWVRLSRYLTYDDELAELFLNVELEKLKAGAQNANPHQEI